MASHITNYLTPFTLVFQLEEVCGIKVVAYHFICVMYWIKVVTQKIEKVLGGIEITIVILNDMLQIQGVAHKESPPSKLIHFTTAWSN